MNSMGIISLILSGLALTLSAMATNLSWKIRRAFEKKEPVTELTLSKETSGFQADVLKMCLEKGLTDVQILPDRNGKISLYDMKQRSGFFHVIAEMVEPKSDRERTETLQVMKQKIDDYLSAMAELNKETQS